MDATETKAVTYPDCRCQKCGSIFCDPYEIYPGPAWCPTCVADDREKQRRERREATRRLWRLG